MLLEKGFHSKAISRTFPCIWYNEETTTKELRYFTPLETKEYDTTALERGDEIFLVLYKEYSFTWSEYTNWSR